MTWFFETIEEEAGFKTRQMEREIQQNPFLLLKEWGFRHGKIGEGKFYRRHNFKIFWVPISCPLDLL